MQRSGARTRRRATGSGRRRIPGSTARGFGQRTRTGAGGSRCRGPRFFGEHSGKPSRREGGFATTLGIGRRRAVLMPLQCAASQRVRMRWGGRTVKPRRHRSPRLRLPHPVRHERGEGWGEGCPASARRLVRAERLLSPALASVPNGGEGADYRRCGRRGLSQRLMAMQAGSGTRAARARAPERAGRPGGGSPLRCGAEPCGIEP